jgi:hypothetical protein
MLIEMCCKCGFVHKDDRLAEKPYRAYKPHYHWSPAERKEGDVTLHATICVGCCEPTINWAEFFEQKERTPEKYRVQGSWNAPLPEKWLAMATELYTLQARYFRFATQG